MGRNNDFQKHWKNATDIGKMFGLSAIAVNKKLAEAGLRNPQEKVPTTVALEKEFAIATPLKDGTPHYMWSVEKVSNIISQSSEKLSN